MSFSALFLQWGSGQNVAMDRLRCQDARHRLPSQVSTGYWIHLGELCYTCSEVVPHVQGENAERTSVQLARDA